MRSKQISMKKLYEWAGGFMNEKNSELATPENAYEIIQKAKEDMSLLNDFLRYVWDHRND